MKLVDLDQTIFVPVVDETHGGAVVEMRMTVGEFFKKCCAGFEPEVVEAVPVVHGEWKWSHGGECSECGFHNSNFDYRYCPMCGAKMDG